MSMSVCLSVSPLAYVKNRTSKFHEIFCPYCPRPWLGGSLTTMEYVMYFRFCCWRHVFLITGHMALIVGSIDLAREPCWVVNFQRIRQWAPCCLTLSLYITASNYTPGAKSAYYTLPCLVMFDNGDNYCTAAEYEIKRFFCEFKYAKNQEFFEFKNRMLRVCVCRTMHVYLLTNKQWIYRRQMIYKLITV